METTTAFNGGDYVCFKPCIRTHRKPCFVYDTITKKFIELREGSTYMITQVFDTETQKLNFKTNKKFALSFQEQSEGTGQTFTLDVLTYINNKEMYPDAVDEYRVFSVTTCDNNIPGTLQLKVMKV
jgi:hypothetical protein